MYAVTAKTYYKGQYGVEHWGVRLNSQGKLENYTCIVWHPMDGKLKNKEIYIDRDSGLRTYAGYTFDTETLDPSVCGVNFNSQLESFDPNLVDENTKIDPFLMREATVEKIFRSLIADYETNRAKKDIKRRSGEPNVVVNHISFEYESFKISSYLLPSYILQYPNTPPRVLPAINKNITQIFGPAPISTAKTVAATIVAAGILAVIFPEPPLFAASGSRVVTIAATSAVTGLYAKYRLTAKNAWQKRKIYNKQQHNESITETASDKKRKSATRKTATKANIGNENSDLHYFKILRLNSNEPLTEEKIKTAFNVVIKKKFIPITTHPII